MTQKKVNLEISGMHCASCAGIIDRKIKKKDGVETSNVNFSTEKATVVYNDEKLLVEDIIKAIKDAGYGAKLNDGTNHRVINK